MICQAIKIMSFSSVLDNRVTIAYIIIYQQPAMVLCGPLYQTRVKEFIQTATRYRNIHISVCWEKGASF